MKTAEYATQMVFPARLVWEDAVAMLPSLEESPANIINQGSSRIPREWLGGKEANEEQEHIAAIMRPDGAEDNSVVVIGCGTIEVRKGVDIFISIAHTLRRHWPSRNYRFIWVGAVTRNENSYWCFLNVQIQRSGLQDCVKFIGEVNSLEPVYAMADTFLLCSRLDPFPNVAIDAMFAELPVVCFKDGSGIAEMLSDQPDLDSLVVPYGDLRSAAEIIAKLSNDDAYRRAIKTGVRDVALSKFNMEQYVERLEELAEEAALIRKQAINCRG
ncbi:MAG: glycosyltransferase [Syntrophobacteraceae bacterium]